MDVQYLHNRIDLAWILDHAITATKIVQTYVTLSDNLRYKVGFSGKTCVVEVTHPHYGYRLFVKMSQLNDEPLRLFRLIDSITHAHERG